MTFYLIHDRIANVGRNILPSNMLTPALLKVFSQRHTKRDIFDLDVAVEQQWLRPAPGVCRPDIPAMLLC